MGGSEQYIVWIDVWNYPPAAAFSLSHSLAPNNTPGGVCPVGADVYAAEGFYMNKTEPPYEFALIPTQGNLVLWGLLRFNIGFLGNLVLRDAAFLLLFCTELFVSN